MTDEELIKALSKGIADVDQQQEAADRIEQLTNTHWQVEAMQQNALLHDALTRAETAEAKLAKAVEESHRWKMECEDFWRKREDAAEAKLAKAVEALRIAIDVMWWVDGIDAAEAVLAKLEKTE